MASIQTRVGAAETSEPDLSPLTVDDYITKRVEDQVKFYDSRSREYQEKNDSLRNITLFFGGGERAARAHCGKRGGAGTCGAGGDADSVGVGPGATSAISDADCDLSGHVAAAGRH